MLAPNTPGYRYIVTSGGPCYWQNKKDGKWFAGDGTEIPNPFEAKPVAPPPADEPPAPQDPATFSCVCAKSFPSAQALRAHKIHCKVAKGAE
jgi:hypothetical protein